MTLCVEYMNVDHVLAKLGYTRIHGMADSNKRFWIETRIYKQFNKAFGLTYYGSHAYDFNDAAGQRVELILHAMRPLETADELLTLIQKIHPKRTDVTSDAAEAIMAR